MRCLAVLGLLLACGGDDAATRLPDAPATSDAADEQPTVVYVVRHGETEGTGGDPYLSATGQARAEHLADLLRDKSVAAILTSQYHRTHDTAVPTANAAGIQIQARVVDQSNIATYGMQLATEVRDMHRAVLVVGHSNTVPDTVMALANQTVPAIAETEYNRLYTITIAHGVATLDAATY